MTFFTFREQIRLCLLLVALAAVPSYAVQLSQTTANSASKAFSYQEKEDWGKAIEVLSSARTPTDYDKAYVNRMLGVLYWNNNQTKNAISALDSAVKLNVLEPKVQWATQRMLADLYMMQQRYRDAVMNYSPLIKGAPSKDELSQIWLRIAQANYQDQSDKNALSAIKEHLKLSSPTVGALTLKLGAEIRLARWKSTLSTLRQLLAMEPAKKTWWLQLVSSYQKLKDQKGMLSALVLAEREGIALNQSERKMLAQLYASQGVPEKAADILHAINLESPDNTSLLMEASYWQQAKEWEQAVIAWKAVAARDPKKHWQVAQLQLQLGDYQAALVTLDKIQEPSRESDVALSKVRAYDKLGDLDSALLYAKRAQEHSPSPQIDSWIQYLSQKRGAARQ